MVSNLGCSHAKFGVAVDVARNITIPVHILDKGTDPYPNTNFEMAANEAFIIPLTDNMKSCLNTQTSNCGLFPNSKYKVMFDVMTDNKALITKTVEFTTTDL